MKKKTFSYATIFFIFLAGCASTPLIKGNSVSVVVSEQSGVEVLGSSDNLGSDPYQFLTPYKFHPPYEALKKLVHSGIRPILCAVSWGSTDVLLRAFVENNLMELVDEKDFRYGLNGTLGIVLPYENVRSLLTNYLESGSCVPSLPPSQWTAGMMGADAYIEFGISTDTGYTKNKFIFFAKTIMTGSGQVILSRETELELSPEEQISDLRVSKFFKKFYRDVIISSTSEASRYLEGGRYLQLILRNVPLTFDKNQFFSFFSKEVNKIEMKNISKDVIMLSLWSKKADEEIERVFFNALKNQIEDSFFVDLVHQDRISFVYEVEQLNGR